MDRAQKEGRYLRRKASGVATAIGMVLVLAFPLLTFAINRTDSILTVLDGEIRKRPHYSEQKEARISKIRQEFNRASDYGDQFSAGVELFNEYSAYQSDSAYRYALILEDLAARHGDPQGEAMSRLFLMDYYTSVGFFKEASELKDKIITRNLPSKYLPQYFNLCNRYLQNIGGYVGGQNTRLGKIYDDQRIAYLDSLTAVLGKNTGPYHIARLERQQILNPSAADALKERLRIVERYDLTNHEKAVQYSLLGRLSLELGKPEDAKYYLAMSALHDIRGNIKETTAAKMLAELLFSESEIEHSYRLIHIAFDDATFYNSHLRKDETSSIMRMIEVEHHNKLNTPIWSVAGVAALIGIMLVAILFLFSKMKKKKHEAEEANEALKHKSEEIDKINGELKNVISELQEVTQIKDEYIMQSLYLNSSFVNKVEEKTREAVRQLKDKKYDALKYLPFEMGIKEERTRIYQSFDKAFLSLFPNFVEEYNNLFPPEEPPLAPGAKELPVEARIFALLRLGVSDPQEVADYLNLSVKTVYVYKTKAKSRSVVANADFEERIKSIPKP